MPPKKLCTLYFFLNLFNLFIYLFLAALGLRCCRRLSLVAVSEGYSSFWCAGFSLRWLLLFRSTGSRCTGFSSCGTRGQQLWLVGSRAQAQQLWHTGLVAPQHVGSSRTRTRTRVPCIGRRILNHCAMREALSCLIFKMRLLMPLLAERLLLGLERMPMKDGTQWSLWCQLVPFEKDIFFSFQGFLICGSRGRHLCVITSPSLLTSHFSCCEAFIRWPQDARYIRRHGSGLILPHPHPFIPSGEEPEELRLTLGFRATKPTVFLFRRHFKSPRSVSHHYPRLAVIPVLTWSSFSAT